MTWRGGPHWSGVWIYLEEVILKYGGCVDIFKNGYIKIWRLAMQKGIKVSSQVTLCLHNHCYAEAMICSSESDIQHHWLQHNPRQRYRGNDDPPCKCGESTWIK